MDCIKFSTITSTNDYLKSYSKNNKLENFFCVRADEQTKGKGQRSNIWKSDCCKNILISFFVRPEIPASKQFLLNEIVSISIIDFLEKFNIPDLKIKYPNDILSGYLKISGILIENVISKNNIKESVIGIGINVNQTNFKKLVFAISMKKLTGKDYDIDELSGLLKQILIKNFNKNEIEINKIYNKYISDIESFPIKRMVR